jgi:hypothetical protein
MNDKALVKRVAGDYVRFFGEHAPAHLREQQEIAAELDDIQSAVAWGDIAEAADCRLSRSD